mgnify:FL=1|jgi:hypothetical protein|tara:strand:- start:4891 stop:5421 length:531 start_codon:yes stop_codon:yes gene_type:complete
MITSIIQNNSSGSIGASQEFSSIALEVSSSQSPQNLNLIENLNRQVFDSASFASTYDTRFTQLGDVNPAIEKFFDLDLATVSNFFTLYNSLFYEIPKSGSVSSHEYIASRSGDYINFVRDQEQIQALLDEISDVRLQNVDLRLENINQLISSSMKETQYSAELAQLNVDLNLLRNK